MLLPLDSNRVVAGFTYPTGDDAPSLWMYSLLNVERGPQMAFGPMHVALVAADGDHVYGLQDAGDGEIATLMEYDIHALVASERQTPIGEEE